MSEKIGRLKEWILSLRTQEDKAANMREHIERNELTGQVNDDGLTSLERWRRDGFAKLIEQERDAQQVKENFAGRMYAGDEASKPAIDKSAQEREPTEQQFERQQAYKDFIQGHNERMSKPAERGDIGRGD